MRFLTCERRHLADLSDQQQLIRGQSAAVLINSTSTERVEGYDEVHSRNRTSLRLEHIQHAIILPCQLR